MSEICNIRGEPSPALIVSPSRMHFSNELGACKGLTVLCMHCERCGAHKQQSLKQGPEPLGGSALQRWLAQAGKLLLTMHNSQENSKKPQRFHVLAVRVCVMRHCGRAFVTNVYSACMFSLVNMLPKYTTDIPG
jgi:hypothetical protein